MRKKSVFFGFFLCFHCTNFAIFSEIKKEWTTSTRPHLHAHIFLVFKLDNFEEFFSWQCVAVVFFSLLRPNSATHAKKICVTKGAILCIIDSLKWSIEWRSTKTIEQRKIRKNKSEFRKLIYYCRCEAMNRKEKYTDRRCRERESEKERERDTLDEWRNDRCKKKWWHNIHNRPLEQWQWPHFCSCWLHSTLL